MINLAGLHLMPRLRAAKRRGLGPLLARLDFAARGWYYCSPLYDLLEHDDFIPKSLLMSPPALKKGKANIGKELLDNQFTLRGQSLNMGHTPDWFPETLSDDWARALHRFEWLKHLAALPKDQGLGHARDLVSQWVQNNARCEALSWDSEVMSTRLVSWLEQAEWLLQDADERFVVEFMFCLNKHANLLPKRLSWHLGGAALLRNIKAMVYVGLCLPQRQSFALEGISLLKDQLPQLVLDDGGFIERAPSQHLWALDDLLDIHALLRKAGHTPPTLLDDCIEQMIKVLGVLRHPDGTLALFGPTDSEDGEYATALVQRGHGDIAPQTSFLPSMGFARLVRGHSVVIMDVGTTSLGVTSAAQHASTLAFEYSIGQHKIFVNQGACVFKPHLQHRARLASAYNTVEVNQESMVEIFDLSEVGRGPASVIAHVEQEPEVGTGIEALQDGYRHLGVKHARRIFLSEDGTDIRGEDELTAKTPYSVKSYFHLHPKVKAKLRNKFEAELQVPGLPLLVLKVRGGSLEVYDGSYTPSWGDHRANQTLVLNGEWRQNRCTLRWGLSGHKSE
jgi:uncharacterized heparinase superfamily protein